VGKSAGKTETIAIFPRYGTIMSMEKGNGKRWYDNYPGLGLLLNKLKNINETKRGNVLNGIKKIIEKHDPDLVDRRVMEFPLSVKKRRWYDKDPYSWLAINSLKYAGDGIKTKVIEYLREKLS
jgi:hypothetical protein